MQLRAEGFFDGADEMAACKAVGVSTGFSVQRIRNLLAFREDDRLVRAVRAKTLRGESAMALATLAEPQRTEQLTVALANPDGMTIDQAGDVFASAWGDR